MIALNPANGILQLNAVYDRDDLSAASKALLCRLIARLYASKPSVSIPTLALQLKMPVNELYELVNTLRRAGYMRLQTDSDGPHPILNTKHPLFELKAKSSAMDRLIKTAGRVPTSGELVAFWRTTYHKSFRKFPPKDQKDLLRMRHIVRHQKEDSMQCIQDYIIKFRNLPSKCNTLGLFLSYGRAKV